MEVIYFQIAILSSIIATYFLKREWLMLVCVAWSIETLVLVFAAPLIIVQLGVIWGAWYLLNNISNKNITIQELERLIDEKPIKVKAVIRSIPEEEKDIIQGMGHKQFLHDSVQSSTKTLIILSGWITEYVVTDNFLKLLENAIQERGVKIYIGYGWRDYRGVHTTFGGAEEVVEKLKKMMSQYPGKLLIAKFANHEKILVKDDYVAYGSNNWLSNSRFKNSERSIVLHSPSLASMEKDRIISIVKSNLIDV